MTQRDVRIAVYGDVNLNVIDGSAIWLQSIASVLTRDPRNQVTVLLKAGVERDLLTRPIEALDGVTVVNPIDEGVYDGPLLSKDQALDTLEKLDAENRFDAVLLRGYGLCHAAARREGQPFHGRMWLYMTEMPQHFIATAGHVLQRQHRKAQPIKISGQRIDRSRSRRPETAAQ